MKAKVLQHLRRPYMMGMLTVSALLVAAIAVPVVIAQTTTTTYYGCVDKKNGALYKVGITSPTCNKGDGTPISWNQQGPAGPAGADGADGADGVDGTNGTNGTNGATTVRTVSHQSTPVIPGSSISHVEARCNTNEKATGGGYNTTTNTPANIAVFQNRPVEKFGFTAGPGWAAGFKNNDTSDKSITVYVICASP
jgi:hypothetical protein